jgi:hypothetical protein
MITRAMLKKADFFMYTGFDYYVRFTRKLRDRGSEKNTMETGPSGGDRS